MARNMQLGIQIQGISIGYVLHLDIRQQMNNHHHFQVACASLEQENTLLSSFDDYVGKEITISMSSDNYGQIGDFFTGLVTHVGLSREHGGQTRLIISGSSPSILLDNGQWTQSFTKKSLSAIVNKITGDYGQLSIKVSPAMTDSIDYITQYKESHFQFINRLSRIYGEWFYYDGKELFFSKRQKSASIEIKLGRELSYFDLSLRLAPTLASFQAYHNEQANLHMANATSAGPSDLDQYGNKVLKTSERFFDQEVLVPVKHLATTKGTVSNLLKRHRSAQMNDTVILSGASSNPLLRLGSTIKVLGINEEGKDIDYGEFNIIQINHSADGNGNYSNSFEAIPASLQSPPLPGFQKDPMCENQVAVVMENDDPAKLGRVRLQFKWHEGTDEMSPWVSTMNTSAGATHGFYFVPEEGDEVMVGFEFNNPDRPYVLGTVYNGKAKPTISDPKNNKKQILTKSGNQILFVDEKGKEEIQIVNGGNTIVMSLSDSGVINITTKGDMTLDAKNINIKASSAVNISGAKITANATGELTAEGGSKATVKGGEVLVESTASSTVKSSGTVEVNGGTATNVIGGVIKLN